MTAPLVVFGEDWGAYPSSTQHLIAALSPGRKVLWVESIGLRRPRLADARRAATKLLAIAGRRPAVARAPDLAPRPDIVFTPAAVPWPGNRLASAVNRRLVGAAVRRQMARAGIERPVLWASLPTAMDAVGTLDERAVVYYCGDDFGALEGVDHAPVLAAEARLAARADLILVSHPALAGKFDPARTRLVPHGVDLARFTAAAPVRSCGTPVAGFVGTIDRRLDVEALTAAAGTLPNWRFELWGPIRHDVGPLAACPNVALRGPLAPADVPGRVRGWDVALLPYRDTAMVRSCNPLKLREYLASGTPIAATPLAALDGYDDLIEVGATPAEFAAAVGRAGSEGRTRARARQERVAGESWQARAGLVADLLADLPRDPGRGATPCAASA